MINFLLKVWFISLSLYAQRTKGTSSSYTIVNQAYEDAKGLLKKLERL